MAETIPMACAARRHLESYKKSPEQHSIGNIYQYTGRDSDTFIGDHASYGRNTKSKIFISGVYKKWYMYHNTYTYVITRLYQFYFRHMVHNNELYTLCSKKTSTFLFFK